MSTPTATTEKHHLDSPVGGLTLTTRDEALVGLEFNDDGLDPATTLEPAAANRGAHPAVAAVARYLSGDLAAIENIRVEAEGTPFQRRVWRALQEIPAGHTWTYAQLAAHIGQPTATRAVGTANGANPIAVVIPCHRVVATGGKLGGYAGGLDRKTWLLRHEGALL